MLNIAGFKYTMSGNKSLYAGICLLVAGCSRVSLTPNQQSLLGILDSFNGRFFTVEAKACLANSRTVVKEYNDDRITGHYNPITRNRVLNINLLDEDPKKRPFHLEDSHFHESLHRLVACDLFDLEKFLVLYGKMDAAEYPIKNEVERLVREGKDPDFDDEHRLVYTAEVWKMNPRYELSPGMKGFFSSFINIDEPPVQTKGLLSINTGIR